MSTFDIGYINRSINTQVSAAEGRLVEASDQAEANPSDVNAMLRMQQEMNMWSNMVNLQSTLVKTLGDTFRGIVQKMP